jgi:hypothetical protein
MENIVNQFISCTLPKEQWTHRAHLIVCIFHLENYSVLESICLLRARIIAYNIASGGQNTTTSGYHETLTQFYVKIIDQFLKANETVSGSFSDKCKKILSSELAENNYAQKFYSKELLFSLTCRATWIEPDLRPLDLSIGDFD